MADNIRFAKAFLSSPNSIGAVAPSSSILSKLMIKDLELKYGESVLEFGPGTGPLTKELRRVLPDHKAYLGIERDPKFADMLEHRFPDMRFVCGLAQDAKRLHKEAGLGPIRAIVSGLPFSTLPHDVQDSILDCLDELLTPGVEFRTFQYLSAYLFPKAVQFRRRMEDLFGPVQRSRAVFRNLPPAYVLRWQR
jgi:phosphatidylethanolamine/phosphatidyl-N-methylethanolamine N-methyltransferase